MGNQHDRVLAFIGRFPGRDDDEIAAALRISPRQTVNIICRRLEQRGQIRRDKLVGRKIVNFPATQNAVSAADKATLVEADIDGELAPRRDRPSLEVKRLIDAGFVKSGSWELDPGGLLRPDRMLPTERGVYAFCGRDTARYVGVASMGIKKRLYFYSKPGKTQRTSQRINEILRKVLAQGDEVDIYTATPGDLSWNGLPVNGSAGLEVGLIEAFYLPWNIRGAR